jgi:excisionase family DNA binding protein
MHLIHAIVSWRNTLLTIAEVAKLSPFSEPQLRGMIQRGELEPVKVGRRLLLPTEEVRRKLGALFKGRAQ